jgi:hypothetical protein
MADQILGELRFTQAGRPLTAALNGELRWKCDDRQMEVYLNEACPIEAGEWDVHRHVVHGLYQVGERLGADVNVLSPASESCAPFA